MPKFDREGDVDDDFGEDLIDDLRDLIDELPTHTPVEEDEYEDALDRFDLDEDELQCFQVRQLALQIEAELVMCGTYSRAQGESMNVSARFVTAQSGAEFRVPDFVAASHEEAARQIFSSFERYVNQSRLVVFCWDDISSQNYQDALDRCSRAIELNDQDARALYGKARALFELGNAAREAAQAARVNNPGRPRAGELPPQARDYFERSLEAHEAVLAVDELHEDALKTAGIAAAYLDRNELARDYFEQYLELNPGDTQVRLAIARDLANAGDPLGALAIAEEGLQQDSTPSMTLITYLGHFALRAAQDMNAASTGAADEDAAGPDSATTAMFERALGYYRQVFEEQGGEADATMLRNIIATLSSLERYDEAARIAEEIVAAKPANASIWSTYATVLNRAGQLDAAIAALDSVQALDSEYPGVWQRKGFWLMRADRLADARPALDSAIAHGEITSDAVAQQIFAYGYGQKYENGMPDEALNVFEVAREYAETARTEAMTKFWTGFILLRQGRRVSEPNTVESAEASLPLFQRALQLFQESEPYTSTQSSISLDQFIGNARQLIEIQELLIDRG